MTSLWGLLHLALLGAYLAAAAPTHPSQEQSGSPPPPPPPPPAPITGAIHRPTSHPMWHLLLALWRPKDAASYAATSATERNSVGIPLRGAAAHTAAGDVQGALPRPYAARRVQLPLKDGSHDDLDPNPGSSPAATHTPLYPEPGTLQHSESQESLDADTPQHPTRNTSKKPVSTLTLPNPARNTPQQHPVPDTPQHPTRNTNQKHIPQHLGVETEQEPDPDTPQHPTRNTQQRPDRQHPPPATSQNSDPSPAQHIDEETQQEPDPDTPQHPTRNTQPKTAPEIPQHSTLKTPQHSTPKTPQHSTPKTPQHSTPKTSQHSTPEAPQHSTPETLEHSAPKTPRHTDPETPQHPDHETPEHSASKTLEHLAPETLEHSPPKTLEHSPPETLEHSTPETLEHSTPETLEHSTPETLEHSASETLEHSTPETLEHSASETLEHSAPEIPQHSASEIPQHSAPEIPQHSAPEIPQHLAPEIPQHLAPEIPQHSTPETLEHSAPETLEHSAPETLEHSAPEIPKHSAPEIPQHSSPEIPQHSTPEVLQHSAPEILQHAAPEISQHSTPETPQRSALKTLKHSAPEIQQHSAPKTLEHSLPKTPQHAVAAPFTQPHAAPQQAAQPYSPISPLHALHALYHPTPHTLHHPVLHIQHHPTSQALLHPTQQPEVYPGTPWRMPHTFPLEELQEDKDPSPHDSADRTPEAPRDIHDTVHEGTFASGEHDETQHPAVMGSHGAYPTAERSSEEDDLPAEPKLDDHFFLHPMPHHRDVMSTAPELGHPDHHHDFSGLDSSSVPTSVEAGHYLSTSKSNSSEVEAEVEEQEGRDREEPPVYIEERVTEDSSAPPSERGKVVLQIRGSGVMESLDDPSLVPLVGQPKDIFTLKDNETAVLALLKVAKTSSSSGDTFQANAMIQAEDSGDPGDGHYSKLSHRDSLRSLEAGTPGTATAKLVQMESDGRDKMAVLVKKDSKSLESRKTVNALGTAEKNQLDVMRGGQEDDDLEITSTMKPIYEEISGTLKVDTSIDDVEDFDLKLKQTESTDDFIPPANTSHTNLIDVALHSQKPSDLPDSSDPSPPSTLTPSSAEPPTPPAPTPQTFSNYPSHYPPKISVTPESDAAATTADTGDGADSWSPFVGSFTDLNASLALNASLIQRSHVLSLEEHYRMVLHERGSLMLQLMDPTADPCEDFYQFACGRWNGKFPIRQDKAVDNTFERLKEDLDDVLRSLLEEEPLPTDNNITLTVKTLYGGCMNTEAIEVLGAEPLLALLQELGGWPVLEGDAWNTSNFDWVRQMARLRNYNNDILISEWVAADITNSSNHIIQLDQPELGLPGREYFINPGDYQYREAYLDLMLNVAQLLGAPLPRALNDMTEVLHFETHLSRILTPAEERRNLSAVHRRLAVDQLSEEVPQIDWALYLDTITWNNNHTGDVVVFGLDYFKKLVSLLEFTDNRTVSNYLLWRFVKNRISNLGERYTKAKQDYIKVLFGRQSQPERWRSCVTYVSGNLGYVVGAMFVKRYFPEASKNDTDEMIGLIRESFGTALRGAHWMNEETRQVAQDKVNTIVKNVGYPEYLLNDTYMDQVYAELSFNREIHFDNVLKMLQFHARTNHDLLSVPVNRTAWVTSPAVVNAYYSRSKNMIVFPAGILQPPFYHPAFPRSLNYGGIGVVIGHEITHGFDDRGRQFDKNGNLQQWWTPSDVSQFYQRASCMLDQYGEYQVDEVGLKINPVNTLGENIADNAGIKISYQAYKNWRQSNEETVALPFVNLTHDQLFFLNFGQIWCEINSPEAMLTKIRSGQHSPNRFRVIGTLSNSEEFSEAFNCPAGSAMNPERKCRVW